jgi:hypothetical protein
MRGLDRHSRGGHATVRDCTVCGKDCQPAYFQLWWTARPAHTCAELARTIAEPLAPAARNCEEWAGWIEAADTHLWRTLWRTPLKDVDNALVSAAARLLQHGTRGDIAGACAALRAHGPAEGETARIPGISALWRNGRSYIFPPEICWVRCEKHRAWCGIGARRSANRRAAARLLDKRRAIALWLIADRSRSCEEAEARRNCCALAQTPSIGDGPRMRFKPAGRAARWIRDDAGMLALEHGAETWATLAPALGRWEAVAAQALGQTL